MNFVFREILVGANFIVWRDPIRGYSYTASNPKGHVLRWGFNFNQYAGQLGNFPPSYKIKKNKTSSKRINLENRENATSFTLPVGICKNLVGVERL